MQRLAWSLFAAALLLSATVVVATEWQLPELVATHFARGGAADRWMAHDRYVVAMLALVVGVPLAIVAATTWVPRIAPRALKLDRCARWSDPAARPRILEATAMFGALEGAIAAACIAGVHLSVIAAHATSPPRLDFLGTVVPVLVAFVVLSGVASFVHTKATRRA